MIFWKEWRETRFSFLMSLFFMTGLYYSIPFGRSFEDAYAHLEDAYWVAVFLLFFGMGYAIIMGAGAFSAEIGGGTLSFLISQPVSRKRVVIAKYLIRGTEAAFLYLVPMSALIITSAGIVNFVEITINIFYPPIVAYPFFKAHSHPLEWMFVPPYIAPQYILYSLLVVLLIFSCSFLCSILLPRKGLAAVGGIMLATIHFSLQGMPVLKKVQNFEPVKTEIYFLILLIVMVFLIGLFMFRMRDY